jgi:hypothetical protein
MRSEWAYALTGPEIPVLAKPCGDCAVECGFYMEISQRLALEDRQTQEDVSKRWFCHNHRGRACRGNWNHLGLATASHDVAAKETGK